MIWSSPDRNPAHGLVRRDTAARAWDWEDLTAPELGMDRPVDQADIDALREEEMEAAYRRGRVEGEQAAHARARREVEGVLMALRRALSQIQESRESWDQRLEENLVALATAMARQIIERELKGDAASFRALVRKAAATFPLDHALRIRLHPADLALLSGANDEGEPAEGDTEGRVARWLTDEDIVPGGCVVEGPDRIVDGRVDEALKRIYWSLTHA
jgi:flagellar biosynthesis/type III secretory pathway protein FliH